MTLTRRPSPFSERVLRLRIPRAEQVKPRQIQIRPVTTGEAAAVEPGSAATADAPTA